MVRARLHAPRLTLWTQVSAEEARQPLLPGLMRVLPSFRKSSIPNTEISPQAAPRDRKLPLNTLLKSHEESSGLLMVTRGSRDVSRVFGCSGCSLPSSQQEGRGGGEPPVSPLPPPFCPLRATGPHATPPGKREGGNCTREIEGLSEGREGGGDPRKGSGKASCELNSPLGRAGTRATVMRGRQEAALSLQRPLLCCVRGPLRPPALSSSPAQERARRRARGATERAR